MVKLRDGYRWRVRPWRPSAQQRRVLDLLVEGRTNPEIAERLGITLDGAKWHVSQLLLETGCERRQELAEWWRREQECPPARPAGLALVLGLLRRAAPLAAVLVVAGGLAGLSLQVAGHGGGTGAGLSASETVSKAAVLALLASPSPTAPPTPTPTPTPAQPGTWVFDLSRGSVTPLPGLLSYRQWVRVEPALFVAGGGVGLGATLIDGDGRMTSLGSPGSRGTLVVAAALQDEGKLLLWYPASGLLRLFDPETKAESLLADVGPASVDGGPSSRQWAITAIGRAIALAEPAGDRVTVMVTGLDGSGLRRVFETNADAWVSDLAWSPDGQLLYLRVAPRIGAGGISEGADAVVVVDREGTVLLRQAAESGAYRWAGPERLLIEPPAPSSSPRTASILDVRGRARTLMLDTAGLLCISPDGRLGMFIVASAQATAGDRTRPARHRVRDLATGAVMLEAETSSVATACDWTWDSERVVVSPGGK